MKHTWTFLHGSRVIQPTVRRLHRLQAQRKLSLLEKLDWLFTTAYITICIVSALVVLKWFFPTLWG